MILIENYSIFVCYLVMENFICGEGFTIPNSVTSISRGAFQGYETLESVNIPKGVTSIGENAFYGCKSLTSVNHT